jgi:hypothetical protein
MPPPEAPVEKHFGATTSPLIGERRIRFPDKPSRRMLCSLPLQSLLHPPPSAPVFSPEHGVLVKTLIRDGSHDANARTVAVIGQEGCPTDDLGLMQRAR